MGQGRGRYSQYWYDKPYYCKREGVGDIVYYDFFGGNIKGIQEKLPYLKELGITAIYLNPIFESSSNHRYGTADYFRVDPMLGTNEEFAAFCKAAKEAGMAIILDGVFSHTGADSIYFNHFGHYPGVGAYQSKESPYYECSDSPTIRMNTNRGGACRICPTSRKRRVVHGFHH